MTRALTAVSCFALIASSIATANTEIPLDSVPENIMDTAIRTAPGVTFDRVSIEEENGVSIYEFEAKDHNGRHIEVDVTEDGDLEEIEMEIPFSDVPADVVATLEATASGFIPVYIEFSVRQTAPIYVYEFDGDLEGRQVSIEIAESGDLLVFSDDLSS